MTPLPRMLRLRFRNRGKARSKLDKPRNLKRVTLGNPTKPKSIFANWKELCWRIPLGSLLPLAACITEAV
jgi:hypothetical protein